MYLLLNFYLFYKSFALIYTHKFYSPRACYILNFTLTCKVVCCAIFNKLHHHIFYSYDLTQGGAPCDEAAH